MMVIANALHIMQRHAVMDAKSYLEAQGLTITKAAQMMGVSTSVLSRPMKGDHWPTSRVLVKMHELSGGEVSLADWIETCRALLEREGTLQPNGK